MSDIWQQARDFAHAKDAQSAFAAANAAVYLNMREDLSSVAAAGPERRLAVVRRLRRVIERERLKGAARHWSYDLNRHIALKQALDLIENGRIEPATKASARLDPFRPLRRRAKRTRHARVA